MDVAAIVPGQGKQYIVHELAGVLADVIGADDVFAVATGATERLNKLYEPVFALDTTGFRGSSDAVANGMRDAGAALDALNNGSRGMFDSDQFIDGIANAIKGTSML